MDVRIRPESATDAPAIEAVTLAAFATAAHSDHREHLIVDALRDAGRLSVSLVAEFDGALVGHVAASPVAIADGAAHWFGLGPVSVVPAHQGRGIGSQLVRAALGRLVDGGAAGCVVLGDPAYYARFGFQVRDGLVLDGVPPRYFQAVALHGRWPQGRVQYHDAFDVAPR